MKRVKYPNFNLVRKINVTIGNYIFLAIQSKSANLSLNRNIALLFAFFCNAFLFAQTPAVNYPAVQSTYAINAPMSLTPVISAGVPSIRTNVSTVAGNGTSGYSDGSTASPKFYSPTGIAIAASGNMYIADSQNHCIRKITASGFVSTFAGSGVAGFLNGPADVAQFNAPYYIAVDASENVYVTETNSYAIRKITQAGDVSTLAGKNTVQGFLDAQGGNALFASPKGMDADAAGNVYVADAGNNRVRKITPAGIVTTVAGDGTAAYLDAQGTSAKLNNPTGVAVNAAGAIYVSDTSNNRIRVISASGTVTTIAGSGSSGMVNGQGTAAQFNAPRAITIDGSGNIFVVDYSNNRIRKITSSGTVSTLAGTGAFGAVNGAGTSATFRYPEGLAADASGSVFVADVTNNCIRKVTNTGDTTTFAGSATRGLENGQGGTMAMFNSPVAVAVTSSGITYLIDDFNSCIRKVTANGVVTTFAGNVATGYADGQGSAAYFNNPKGIALDAAGNIYIADTFNNRIRKVTPAGAVTTIAGDGTAGYLDGQGTAAKFNNPYGLTVDASGNIYVADTKNNRIRKITPGGTVTTVAGYLLSGFADGAANVARFKNPQGIAIDNATGILYVVDTSNNRIRKIENGTVSTFAGSFAGYQDDQGTAAYFNNPIGIAIDSSGDFYIGDYFNSVIRKITSEGLVSTYAGSGLSEYADGIGNVASFYFPVGVAVTASGDVYVADSYTQRIRKITSVDPFEITPALPAGMTFNTSTGVISGTPTEVRASMTYTIEASNYNGTGTATITFATGSAPSAPAAPTAAAQSFCNAATVSNLVAAGTALKWYDVAIGGTALASTTTLISRTYYVSQTVNSVESTRTSVVVTINVTAAPTASSQSFCGSATVANLTASGTGLKWYNLATGGTALASTTALTAGNYYVSQTLNSCESPRTAVAVTINTTPAPTASAQTFSNSATVSDLVATGNNLQWYTASSGGTALASNTVLSSGSYYVSQTINSCESARILVSVTINSAPGAPAASSQTFCNSATVANLVATGTGLKWYNAATGGTVLASATAVSTGNYYVSQTVNSVESARTAVIVTVNVTANPSASSQAFCNTATVADLDATGVSLKWYTAVTGGSALSSATALTTRNYYVSQTLNSCESPRTTVAVTINTTPAPTASAQTFNNSATVSNLVATGSNLQWYTTSTGGTALASNMALSTGNYYVSQTLNSCESLRTLVSVTVNTAPGAPTASAQSFCNSATVSNLAATGTALKWYLSATGGTVLASATALTTRNYYVSQTLNSIESARTAVAVTINITPAPTASAQSFCNAATVSDLDAAGTSLKWYTTSTGGTALASTIALTTRTYYVSQTLNSCEGPRTAVSITVNTTPAPTASAQSFCNAATVSDLDAAGTSLKWYTTSTGGTALASTIALTTRTYYVSQTLNSCEGPRTAVSATVNTTPAPTASAQTFNVSATVDDLVANGNNLQWYTASTGGTALLSTTALTTRNYYVSQTLNSCESSRILVSVTIVAAPNAPTASAQSFCNEATIDDLFANGTSLQWYAAAAGGSVLASTTALANGTYYVSQTVNSIESSRTPVSVTINMTPAPAASSQTFNNSATVANLVANGTALRWYPSATGGTALTSGTALSSGMYYVSQTLNSCESDRTAVQITINTAPGAPTASAQTFCSGATVSNLVAAGTALRWYNVATGGTALASTAALSTRNYYVTQTVNSIESTRTAVAVTINNTPPPSTSSQTFCNGATVSNLVASGSSIQWYTVGSGGTALAPTTLLTSGVYYVSQTLNSCESQRMLIGVTITTPAAPTASAQTFNNLATVANLVASGTSLRWYATATGGTALASTTVLSSGDYYVSQTVNSCESNRTLVEVTIIPATGAPTASAQSFCNSATVADLVAVGTDLNWYDVITGGIALASGTALSTGNYYVSQTVNSVESARTAVAVTVNMPSAPTASPQTFCSSSVVGDLIAGGVSLQWYNVAVGGTVLPSNRPLTAGNYYVSQLINSCESPRTSVAVAIQSVSLPVAVASQPFCDSAAVSDLVASGNSIKWYNAATGGTPLSPTAALSTGNYYVSQTLNSCESARVLVSVTINTISAPIASSQSFCNSATVSDLVANGNNLQWYTALTGGTALASNAVLSTGNYYVSQTLNSCESPRTLIFVTVNAAPNAPTASAQTFNNSATVANLVANGSSLKWYAVATGGMVLTSTTALSTGNYYVSQTVGNCESLRTLVSVTVNAAPGAPTASAQSFCNSATVADLAANGTSLKWYTAATGGTALASNTALTTRNYYVSQTVNSIESTRTLVAVTINSTAAPTATAQIFNSGATVANLAANGISLKWYTTATGGSALPASTALTTRTYYVSQTLNFCESPRTAVSVTITTTPAAPAASAQSFCNSATVANLVAAGTSLKWYANATGGSVLALNTALSTRNYYVSQTVNSVESARTMVAVTINVTAAPTASAQIFNNSATVANLVANGTALKWYASATGGTALATATSLSTGNYYVSQTLNFCESRRTLVAVTINGSSVVPAPAASAQSFCSTPRVFNLVASGTALKWYASAAGGSALSPTANVSSGNYYVSQTINSVESPRTLVAITVYATAVTSDIVSETSPGTFFAPLCTTDTKVLYLVDGYAATNIQWERAVVGLNTNIPPASSSYIPIEGATEPSYTVTNAVAGRNYYRVKFTNGNCESTAIYSEPSIVFYKSCTEVAKLSAVGYPNPFENHFKISLNAPTEENVVVSVYDMMGKLMDTIAVSPIEISELQLGQRFPSGVYNVVIAQGEQIKTIRLIKR